MSEYHPGMGCHCCAHSENECCCPDVDWRSEREVELEELVEKLTKERDDFHMGYRMKCDEETKQLEVQLAALAEQNEKMREALSEAKNMVGHPDNIAIIDTALSLPNLATPVLNRIKAEGMRMAARMEVI